MTLQPPNQPIQDRMGQRASVRQMSSELRRHLETEPMFGGWAMLGSTMAIEALAAAGSTWIGIDCQHGFGQSHLENLVRTADVWNLASIVRVPWNSPEHIMAALDAGAAGIIVPMVNDREEAIELVRWSKFAPDGRRSWGPLRPPLGDRAYNTASANAGVLIFPMIETSSGLENVEAILGVEGVSGIFLGPSDLAISLTGELVTERSRPELDNAIATVLDAALKAGKIPGYSCASAEEARIRAAQGYRLLPVSNDYRLLVRGMSVEVGASAMPEGSY